MSDDIKDNPWALLEDKSEPSIPRATLEIYASIQALLGERNESNVDRASSATMCVKRRWYQHHGYDATPLTPRKLVNFLQGDLAERTLLYFITQGCVGPGKLYSEVDLGEELGSIHFQNKELKLYKQKTLRFTLPGTEQVITGHADGFGKRNSDGKWELIEIKSAADYGFDKFKRSGPEDYLKQSHALFEMNESYQLGVDSVRFFYLKKSTGHVWDKLYQKDQKITAQVIQDFKTAVDPFEPEAPHSLTKEAKTGRTIAKFPCSYCPYLQHCHGPFEKEFTSRGSPVFVFNDKLVFTGSALPKLHKEWFSTFKKRSN